MLRRNCVGTGTKRQLLDRSAKDEWIVRRMLGLKGWFDRRLKGKAKRAGKWAC